MNTLLLAQPSFKIPSHQKSKFWHRSCHSNVFFLSDDDCRKGWIWKFRDCIRAPDSCRFESNRFRIILLL